MPPPVSIPLERNETRPIESGPRLSTWVFRGAVILLFAILVAVTRK